MLDSHGCADEPLAWSPPPEWADTENLPLPDLDRLDMYRLAVLLRGRRSPTAIADDLGTSLTTSASSSADTPASPCCQDRAEGPLPLAERSARCPREPDHRTAADPRAGRQKTLRSLPEEFGVNRTYWPIA